MTRTTRSRSQHHAAWNSLLFGLSLSGPSDIQVCVKRLTAQLKPSTVGVVHGVVSGIFRAAVRDRVIAYNPCEGTKLPKVTKPRVEPLDTKVVLALADAVPDQYRALVILSAGSGMRQGECFGLTVDKIDFLRRVVHVDRQLLSIAGLAILGAAEDRSVCALDPASNCGDRCARGAPGELPGRRGRFCVRSRRQADSPIDIRVGMACRCQSRGCADRYRFHELQHYYASLLIRHGQSVKVVQARLGHASASETLDTYSHLWPDSDDHTRTAVDSVLLADSVRTGEVVDGQNS
jgi:integrase